MALDLLWEAYHEPSTAADDPAAQVHREALAGLLAVRAASKLYALSRFVVLIRGDCQGALAALRNLTQGQLPFSRVAGHQHGVQQDVC